MGRDAGGGGMSLDSDCQFCHGAHTGSMTISGSKIYHNDCAAEQGVYDSIVITPDVYQAVMRSVFKDRAVGSYFVLAADFQLIDVTAMVRQAAETEHRWRNLLRESLEWIAELRSRWSPPAD